MKKFDSFYFYMQIWHREATKAGNNQKKNESNLQSTNRGVWNFKLCIYECLTERNSDLKSEKWDTYFLALLPRFEHKPPCWSIRAKSASPESCDCVRGGEDGATVYDCLQLQPPLVAWNQGREGLSARETEKEERVLSHWTEEEEEDWTERRKIRLDGEKELRFLFSFLSRELKTLAEEATKVKSFNFLFFFLFCRLYNWNFGRGGVVLYEIIKFEPNLNDCINFQILFTINFLYGLIN